MNDLIVNNLYEFWRCIGKLNNSLTEVPGFSAVSIKNSDWPNRIFDLKNSPDIIDNILIERTKETLPEIIAVSEPNDFNLKSNPNFEYMFRQTNMALELNYISKEPFPGPNIQRVQTEKDSADFAGVASDAFEYSVDQNTVFKIVNYQEFIRLFIYKERSDCLGCGIVFVDSKNSAGLHMIGTLPKARGKGIGNRMTKELMVEAKDMGTDLCVLHASDMGTPIYKKLGFQSYGRIETYRIVK